MAKLTVHCMVRNEPFVWYAVMSVYPYVDKILLYDTGSDDDYTLNDIRVLVKADVDHKITHRRIPMVFDTTHRSPETARELQQEGNKVFNMGHVRQMMIDDTETDYFLVLDGDEVYYNETLERIRFIIDRWPHYSKRKAAIAISLNWFTDLEHVVPYYTPVCRVFKTLQTKVEPFAVGEMYYDRVRGDIFTPMSPRSITATDWVQHTKQVRSYAHFAFYLKPGQHRFQERRIIPFVGKLPEVMQEQHWLMQRYEQTRRRESDVTLDPGSGIWRPPVAQVGTTKPRWGFTTLPS